MTRGGLLWRNLRHHVPAHLAAALGVAVATAAIVAALLVGAAMRQGLRQRALDNLGPVTHLVAPPQGLAAKTAKAVIAAADGHGVAVLAADGTCEQGDDGTAVPRVRIIGIGTDWLGLTGVAPPPRGTCVISQALAGDLRLHRGSEVVLAVERAHWAADGTLFAQHRRDRRIATLRASVARITAPGDTDHIAPWRDLPPGPVRAVWLERGWLGEITGNQATVGDLLLSVANPDEAASALRCSVQPADFGLRVQADADGVRVEAQDLLLDTDVAEALPKGWRNSVYLADRISFGAKSCSYAMVASMEPFPGDAPPAGGIILNRWLADDLGAGVGAMVRLAVPVPDGDGSYPLDEVELRVAGIVPMEGFFADPQLVPSLPGITDADDLARWDAPFPIDLKRVTKRDDAYWEAHRATPKAFLHPRELERIWRRAGGHGRYLTGIQLPGAQLDIINRQLRQRLDPSRHGLELQPVRDQAELAALGSSDLGGLFLGLGIFIVAAGAGLAGVILRLGLLRRASEIGVLRATGWTPEAVRRVMVAEGAFVALAGALMGTALGLVLTGLLLDQLAGPWAAAGGGLTLRLVWDPQSLGIGFAVGTGLGILVAWWSAGFLVHRDIPDLLAGWRAAQLRQPAPASALVVRTSLVALVIGVSALALGLLDLWPAPWVAGIAGMALLVGGLAGARWFLASQISPASGQAGLGRLLLRGLAAAPLRAVATLALAACASFILVAVAAQRRQALPERSRDGGYELIVETTLVPGYDLSTSAGRLRLGFTAAEDAAVGRLVGLAVAPGDGVSCQDPGRPLRPRLVALPAALRDSWPVQPEGGWSILDAPGDAVPVVGDADSLQWILHAPIGTRLPYDRGELAVVGVLPAGSIFAGDLLVAPERLRQLRPDAAVTRWLVDAPDAVSAAQVLRRRLAPYGASVTTTAEAIAALGAVRTAYLDAFLALGGVGLFLAALGVAALVLRGAEERRWEMALLIALGLGRLRLALVLAGEQSLLLAAGLLLGSASALLVSQPALDAPGAAVAWKDVTLVLGGVLALGTLMSVWSGWWGARPRPGRLLAEER